MPAPKVAETPNVLLLFVDQMRYDAMACAGHPAICTPALDRLAAEGTRFTRAYSPVPVCIAARHSLLYGHRCATHGRFANNVPETEPLLYSLPQLLSFHGYATRAIGKMHWRPVRRHHGFDRMELMEEIPDHRGDDEYLLYLQRHGYGHVRAVHGIRHLLYMTPQRSVLPEEHHGSTWVADRTIDFLRSHRDRPFFCWSSWIAPHPPFNAPEPFASMYAGEAMPPPVQPDRDPATLPPSIRGYREMAGIDRLSRDCWQRVRALYHAQVSLIDKGVGRILHALDELGLADNTLVIFTSDHGEMLGDFGLWQKSQPWDGSARLPFLMRLPGRVAAGAERDELVSLLDILPTCLDVAGLDYPGTPDLPGASLLGADGGGAAAARESLIVEHGKPPRRWLSALRGSLKYNLWFEDGWEELYDLEADPQETRNLLLDGDGDARAAAAGLRREVEAWEQAHGFGGQAPAQPVDREPTLPKPSLNLQFPRWIDRLDPRERAVMNSLGEEMEQVLAGEDTFSIEELDVETWAARGGEVAQRALAYLRAARR